MLFSFQKMVQWESIMIILRGTEYVRVRTLETQVSIVF